MDDLVALSQYFLKQADKPFHRQLTREGAGTGDFERPCTLVVGQRGVGKTTLALQHLRSLEKENAAFPDTLYVPCDHYLVQGQSLYDIAETFSLHGGQIICFDEIIDKVLSARITGLLNNLNCLPINFFSKAHEFSS